MNPHGVSLRARGMHCSGCEHIIEVSVRQLPGVRQVKADYPSETVAVVFDPSVTCLEDICAAIARKGYRCSLQGEAEAPRHPFKMLAGTVLGLAGILLIIFIDTQWISQSGAPDVSQHMGYGLILALGLLTGFHCVGMCGGFVLSYTAADAKMGQSSHQSHLLYAAGKTLSYTVIGGIFGLLGAVIAFTPMLRGLAGIGAGIFLIIFGLNMLNVFPVLRKIQIKLPAALSWALTGKQARSRGRPFVIGLLNGGMIACGPLQAMYVMAAGTGSAIEGAKMLFTFGVGTLPVLLSFGFLTSLISASATHQLLRASGVILILLGAVMMNRGLILTGAGYDLQSVLRLTSNKLGLTKTSSPTPPVEGNFQTITMDVIKSGFDPNHFILRQGIKVKWVINGKEVTECNRRIVVPKLGLEFDVKAGMQTIEFTPHETGIIPWSCWMGMLHGQFEVIAEPGTAQSPPMTAGADQAPSPAGGLPPPVPAVELSRTAANPSPAGTYRIVAGDTLAKIARKHYKGAVKWREIARANPGLDPLKLRAGQIIRLPPPPVQDNKDYQEKPR